MRWHALALVLVHHAIAVTPPMRCLVVSALVHHTTAGEVVPRTLVETDDIPLQGEDRSDTGAAWVKEGHYAALRKSAEASGASLELRANAALTYLLEGDLGTADVVLSHLARWCRARWNKTMPDDDAIAWLHAPCGAVMKNLHWTLDTRETHIELWDLQDEIMDYYRARLRSALRGVGTSAGKALTPYDVGLGARVCAHRTLQEQVRDPCSPTMRGAAAASLDPSDAYLDLLRRGLTNFLHADWQNRDWRPYLDEEGLADDAAACAAAEASDAPPAPACEQPWGPAWRAAGVSGLASGVDGEEDERQRRRFQTTLAVADLVHLEVIVDRILEDQVQGDFMEAGVFRGGTCIFLRGILMARREETRRVYVADSFAGIPPPRRRIEDVSTGRVLEPELDPTTDWVDRFVAGEELVRYNFRRYGLLDERVHFLRGFFNDSLPPVFGSTNAEHPVVVADSPILALLRIDADAYDGVLDALEGAYHRLSPGGFVIIDDWHLGGARAACHFFRRRFNITGPIRSSPSDLVLTCGTDLTEVARCAHTDVGRALLAQSKAYTVTVLPHVAFWRKGWGEPGPSVA
jgi:hypothetical protein